MFSSSSTIDDVGSKFAKYFKVIKNCGSEPGTGCWATNTNKNYDGSGDMHQYDLYSYYKFVTTAGMSFMIFTFQNNCQNEYGKGEMTRACGQLWLDVNGTKNPNKLGKDTFVFWITNGRGASLYPQGGKNDSNGSWWNYNSLNRCSSSGSHEGAYCTGRILEKGWVMDY